MASKRIGKPLSKEARINMSIAQRKLVKEGKSHFWNGGVSTERHKIRNCTFMRQWRDSVFKRDNWTCQICHQRGNTLNADHIVPFAKILQDLIKLKGLNDIYENAIKYEQFWDISNGRTLCVECHRKTDTWGKHIKY